ncbi:MAG: hypothetical protein H7A23_07280 [Leptospiraceae bacterium]|nr:hypothetical protein [Leptospiraceae bacterium]MCP5494342.1 hypothetical protein [Leptospiraceae bacterium]
MAYPTFFSVLFYSSGFFGGGDFSKNTFAVNTVDFGFNYHFLGDGFLDPYVGFGFSKGKCSDSIDCSKAREVTKTSLKAGLQFNFSNYFAMLQIEFESIDFGNDIYFDNDLYMMGLGMRF